MLVPVSWVFTAKEGGLLEFETSWEYTENSRLSWATYREPLSQKQNKTLKQWKLNCYLMKTLRYLEVWVIKSCLTRKFQHDFQMSKTVTRNIDKITEKWNKTCGLGLSAEEIINQIAGSEKAIFAMEIRQLPWKGNDSKIFTPELTSD